MKERVLFVGGECDGEVSEAETDGRTVMGTRLPRFASIEDPGELATKVSYYRPMTVRVGGDTITLMIDSSLTEGEAMKRIINHYCDGSTL